MASTPTAAERAAQRAEVISQRDEWRTRAENGEQFSADVALDLLNALDRVEALAARLYRLQDSNTSCAVVAQEIRNASFATN